MKNRSYFKDAYKSTLERYKDAHWVFYEAEDRYCGFPLYQLATKGFNIHELFVDIEEQYEAGLRYVLTRRDGTIVENVGMKTRLCSDGFIVFVPDQYDDDGNIIARHVILSTGLAEDVIWDDESEEVIRRLNEDEE